MVDRSIDSYRVENSETDPSIVGDLVYGGVGSLTTGE